MGISVDCRNTVHLLVCMLSPTTIGEEPLDAMTQRAQMRQLFLDVGRSSSYRG